MDLGTGPGQSLTRASSPGTSHGRHGGSRHTETRPFWTRPSARRRPQQRRCSRGGTSLQPLPMTGPLPAGSAGLAGPEGARVPPPWASFPRPGPWARALPQTPAGGTRRPTLGGLALRPEDAAECAATSQAGAGGGAFRTGSPGSSPFRGPSSRPLARQANHRGPMTTRPDPSRPGPRETTEREPEAASLLSSLPPLQQQLLGSTETPAHLCFPRRPALRDGT